MTYDDPRRFSVMTLFATEAQDAQPFLKALGPEPDPNAFSPASLDKRSAGRRTPVKAALLDQHSVAGPGNIHGREGADCRCETCGGTISRLVRSGSSTIFCPACQR